MARTATPRIRFVETAVEETSRGVFVRDYNVEVHTGQVRATIGRIMGGGRSWAALPVGATAWTRWHTTRAAALHALQAREDFQFPHTYILAA
jgi:hypothetical protein